MACLELLLLEERYKRLYESLHTSGTTMDRHSWRTSTPTMHNHTAKQDAIEAIEQLPDNVPMDEIVYRLYVLNKVRQGMQDIEAGRSISSADLAREIEQW